MLGYGRIHGNTAQHAEFILRGKKAAVMAGRLSFNILNPDNENDKPTQCCPSGFDQWKELFNNGQLQAYDGLRPRIQSAVLCSAN